MKLCKNCKFWQAGTEENGRYDVCLARPRPSIPNLIRGGSTPGVATFCGTSREYDTSESCGPDGKFWEAK